MSEEGHDVIVVGGGLAGLTAARKLRHADRRVRSWMPGTVSAAERTRASWLGTTSSLAARSSTGSSRTSSP
jgi:succinate dehydrogenase/fumarate reductase flavoprotein subunit